MIVTRQHNHAAVCKETCPYLFWLNWWWRCQKTELKSCDNFSEVTQIQFDFWQGDAIYKAEHAISGAGHLHNEDTSISSSDVCDGLELKAGEEWELSIEIIQKRADRGSHRIHQRAGERDRSGTVCSGGGDARWPWQKRDGGASCPELQPWLWTHRGGVGPQEKLRRSLW